MSRSEWSLPLRVVYFGTPEYAVPALRALNSDERFLVTLVVTQPDRPAGRGHAMQASAVKQAANELGLPIYQPESLRKPQDRQPLIDQHPDLFVVAAYGIIFGPKTLAIPRFGCANLHASLLPKYRGASPISAAILAGDEVAGVTLMEMGAGMDTGDMIAVRQTPIDPDDTTISLTAKLAQLGADLVTDSLPGWVSGEISAVAQPTQGATLVRPMVKADGWLKWDRPAVELERQVRAMFPWPKAWTSLPDGRTMQVVKASVADGAQSVPGVVRVGKATIEVGCGIGALRLERMQIAGSPESDAAAAVNGRKLVDGDRLGEVGKPEVPPPLIRPAEE